MLCISKTVISILGIICTMIGGILLATQIPTDVILRKSEEGEGMVLDDRPETMCKYKKKVFLYRLGLAFLVIGSILQCISSLG